MTRPMVTVVMNCFNGEAFLRQAIDSVIAQTWTDWEIVFWDNQSTDGSAAIVNSYDDPRIHYHYAPTHTLLYEARNYAIEYAQGELLAFLDVDDWWLPEKLAQQVALFNDSDVAMACGNFWIQNDHKDKRWMAHGELPQGQVLDQLLESYFLGLLTLMVRRSALPDQKWLFDPRYHIIGDYDLVIRLAAQHKLASVQAPIAVYRIHGGNETGKRRQRHLDELKCWQGEMAQDPVIGASKAFGFVAAQIAYIQGLGELLDGHRRNAFACFRKMGWGRLRLRLLVALLMPLRYVRMLKN